MKTIVMGVAKANVIKLAESLGIPVEETVNQYDHLVMLNNPVALAGVPESMYVANGSKELWSGDFAGELHRYASDPKKETFTSDGGGGKNHYDLPKGATQLLDLIEYRNMNGNIKDIFKACYRKGLKEDVSEEYDARKMVLYSLRELGRITNRKDYLVLAEEVIGHHDQTGAKVEGTKYSCLECEKPTEKGHLFCADCED